MSASPGRYRRWLAWLPAVAIMAVIFVLSAQSGLRLSDDAEVDRPFRVTGHLLAYATLAALLLIALSWGRRPRLRDAVLAFGISVVYGVTDEWHQSFVPDRTGRFDDVMTDAVGALIGVAVAWLTLRLTAVRRARRSGATT